MKIYRERIFLTTSTIIILCMSFITILLCFDIGPVYSADKHVLDPRVPANKMAEAKAIKRATLQSDATIAKGKAIFHGKGVCTNCHGEEGKGNGPLANSFNPRPRDFTDADDIGWHKVRTDGEIFWAISKGTEYGMIPFEDMLSEEERWELVDYIRSLGKPLVANHK